MLINMADVVDDPDFSQPIKRITRTESINEFGEPVLTEKTMTINAVVTVPTAGNFNRYEDSTNLNRSIMVTTTFPLNPDYVSGQPDVVVVGNEHYIVVGIENYAAYGYYRSICQMIDFEAQRSKLVRKEQECDQWQY